MNWSLEPATGWCAVPAADERDLFAGVLSTLGVGVITTDAAGRVEWLDPLAERLTEWTTEAARGLPLAQVLTLSGEDLALPAETPIPLLSVSAAPGGSSGRAQLISRTGKRFTVEYAVATLGAGESPTRRFLVALRDVSRETLALLQLTRHATHDPLTGLLNREALTAHLDRTLREHRTPFAFCHLDLDQFNLVNNACGHTAGDELLRWVAALLREECRDTDVVARLGGDVFGLLLGNTTAAEAQSFVHGFLARLACFQFRWEDRTFPVGGCVGLVPVTGGKSTAREVLALADYACSQAKRHGRNQIRICPAEGEENLRRQKELEWVTRIRSNLREGKAALYAQAIRPLSRQAPPGAYFEVLLRVASEDGYTSAEGLIQAAERYGLVGIVDRWVIRSTLDTLATRPPRVLAQVRLCSLNLSAVSLHDRSILEFIHQELARTRVPPQKVCFELTETAVVENLAQARWLIQELLAVGCRFALDDFGSGIASYGHLSDLPVNYLKIAGSFVENIAASPLNTAMVASINQIARVLGIETIAESVSTASTLRTVESIGVDFAQGTWIAEPRPLGEVCPPA